MIRERFSITRREGMSHAKIRIAGFRLGKRPRLGRPLRRRFHAMTHCRDLRIVADEFFYQFVWTENPVLRTHGRKCRSHNAAAAPSQLRRHRGSSTPKLKKEI